MAMREQTDAVMESECQMFEMLVLHHKRRCVCSFFQTIETFVPLRGGRSPGLSRKGAGLCGSVSRRHCLWCSDFLTPSKDSVLLVDSQGLKSSPHLSRRDHGGRGISWMIGPGKMLEIPSSIGNHSCGPRCTQGLLRPY
jgi:hypothetical protein